MSAPFWLRVLATLGLVALIFGGGVGVGDHWATQRTAAARAKAADQALKQYQADVKAGEDTVAAVREQLALKGRYMATLEQRLSNAPSLIPAARAARRPGPVQCAAAAAAGPAAAGGAAGAAAAAGPQGAEVMDDVAADPGVTLAAVSLWNSALAGHDMPAGACRADALADPACAAGSGLTLADAWRNQQANAQACAADRARYQGLIDYLNHRQGRP